MDTQGPEEASGLTPGPDPRRGAAAPIPGPPRWWLGSPDFTWGGVHRCLPRAAVRCPSGAVRGVRWLCRGPLRLVVPSSQACTSVTPTELAQKTQEREAPFPHLYFISVVSMFSLAPGTKVKIEADLYKSRFSVG